MYDEIDFSQFLDNNFGWAGADRAILERALSEAPPELVQPLQIYGDKPPLEHLMLFRLTRKVLGKDTENFPQKTGDCTAFGAKNVGEYLECCQIVMGSISNFRPIFPCYTYGTGRMIGHMLGNGAGCVGIYIAQSANQYGFIARDDDNVPEYSKQVAEEWGRDKSAFEKFIPTGKEHLVKKIAKVSSWSDLLASITNLYPVTVASDYGFTQKPMRDGYHHREGSWSHQMAIIGIDDGDQDKGIEPHACVLNSWGLNAMGEPVKDFRDPNLIWPGGTLRVRKRDIEGMLAQNDSWAYSSGD